MVKSVLQKTATPYVATNFKTSKMGKTWYFIKNFRRMTSVSARAVEGADARDGPLLDT